jgi:hypothetical protein
MTKKELYKRVSAETQPLDRSATAAVRLLIPLGRSKRLRKACERRSVARKTATLEIPTQNRIVGMVVLEDLVGKKSKLKICVTPSSPIKTIVASQAKTSKNPNYNKTEHSPPSNPNYDKIEHTPPSKINEKGKVTAVVWQWPNMTMPTITKVAKRPPKKS